MNSAKRFSVTPGKTDAAENQARAPCLHIIMETEADVVDRLRYLHTVLVLPVDYDVFCYTPTEWDQIQHKPFWRHARRSDIILHERR